MWENENERKKKGKIQDKADDILLVVMEGEETEKGIERVCVSHETEE